MPDVRIRVEQFSREEAVSQKQGEEVAGKETNEKLAVASLFAHQAISTAKQITSYAVSNIGNFTGDYILQDKAQTIANRLTSITSLGVAYAAGGAAGLVVAGLGMATKSILQEASFVQDMRHKEANAEYLRARSGESTKNGSR